MPERKSYNKASPTEKLGEARQHAGFVAADVAAGLSRP